MNAVDTLTPECVDGVVFIVVILWRQAVVLSPKCKRLLVAGARDAPPARAGERGAAVAAFLRRERYGRGRGMLSAAGAVTTLEQLACRLTYAVIARRRSRRGNPIPYLLMDRHAASRLAMTAP